MRELALFAGAGGGLLGGALLGWRTVCAVEIDPYCRRVLLARQRDGLLDPFPIWDDVRTFDGKPWRGHVDLVSGGFPCQDISLAGRGDGLEGERSGLWVEMARVISEVRPSYVFVENAAALAVRGFGRVLEGLADMGFDAEWGVLGADDAGAPHIRKRMWILAANPDRAGREEQRLDLAAGEACAAAERGGWWSAEPDVGRMAHGVAFRVDRLRAIGNGQVPLVAALAARILGGRLGR